MYALQYASSDGARTALRALNCRTRRSHQTTDPVHPQPQLRGGLDPVTRRRPPRYLARVALPRIARPTTRTL
uniref:SFRICE_028743 n=1 Tax=Spodoptera frugiperda TaxID=7108 RepID=A0A2H1WBC8_SPOFR